MAEPEPIPHPLRVRVYGGRATHAARELDGGGHLTVCDYYLSDGSVNHWMPPTNTVTCGRCAHLTPASPSPA